MQFCTFIFSKSIYELRNFQVWQKYLFVPETKWKDSFDVIATWQHIEFRNRWSMEGEKFNLSCSVPLAFLHNASIFLKSNFAHVTFKYMNPRLDQLQFLHCHVTKNNDHYIQRISLNSVSY